MIEFIQNRSPVDAEELRRFYISFKEEKYPIYEVIKNYKGRFLPFTVENTWTDEEASQYIERIIYQAPLDPFYFKQTVENELIIHDGKKRLSIILSFINNEFSLKGLDVLHILNGLYYKDLKEYIGVQAKIEMTKLIFYTIKPSQDLEMVDKIIKNKRFK